MLQKNTAERQRMEREQRQKLKQKAREKERTAKERAAAEREASEREARSQQEAETRRQKMAAAAERWGCVSGVPAGTCVVQCFGPAAGLVQQRAEAVAAERRGSLPSRTDDRHVARLRHDCHSTHCGKPTGWDDTLPQAGCLLSVPAQSCSPGTESGRAVLCWGEPCTLRMRCPDTG